MISYYAITQSSYLTYVTDQSFGSRPKFNTLHEVASNDLIIKFEIAKFEH